MSGNRYVLDTKALRRRGIDITTTREARLLGAADEEQLAFAISEERAIFT